MVTATQKFAAELIGTFFLVFIGTGALPAVVYSKQFLSGKEE